MTLGAKKLLAFVSLSVFSTSFFVAEAAKSKETTTEKIKRTKILKVCSESGYLPLEMKSASGTWYGIDPEMMQNFSNELSQKWNVKIQLEMMDTKWDGIIPSLLSGKCDAIASSMAKTPERSQVVLFSNSYFSNHFLIAMRNTSNNKKSYAKLADLNKKDIRVAVKTGSSPDLYLQNSNLLNSANILKFDADADTVNSVLLTDKADAFIYDVPYVKLVAANNPGKVYILPNGFGGDEFGVAFRKQDKDFSDLFNSFLKQWKQNGGYKKTFHKYLETTDWMELLKK